MKNRLYKLLILGSVLFGVLFVSCSNDDPFEGTDNYITSFSLSKDGVAYKAEVVNDMLKISAAKNIDFTDATVSYTLSELATISPNPSAVKSWNDELKFTVTSHGNNSRTYTFRLERVEMPAANSVTLLTQTDVDQFAALNIEVIDGDLILGTNDATETDLIKNLDGLLNLKKITNNLIFKSSFASTSLTGLKNLESVGNIYIKSLAKRDEESNFLDFELPNLATTGDLYIDAEILRSVHFAKLGTLFSCYINGKTLEKVDFPLLKTVLADFTIQSGTSSSVSTANQMLKDITLGSLSEIHGSISFKGLIALEGIKLPLLKTVGSSLSLENLSDFTLLEAPQLNTIKQTFLLKGLDAMKDLSLPELTYSGSFEYTANSGKEKLTDFNLLKYEECGGDFKFTRSLVEVLNLPALNSVANSFSISNNSLMTGINVPSLQLCNKMELSTLPVLKSLDISKVVGLEKFSTVSCYKLALVKSQNIKDVSLNGGSTLCDFTQFEGLEIVSGSLAISNYTKNANISYPGIKHISTYNHSGGIAGETIIDFPDLETIGTLKITSASYLKKLNAPKLTTVSDTWDTSYMNNVSSGDINVPKLTKIGTFKFYGATYAGGANQMKLTNLNDFSSLTEVGKLEVKWWGTMTDFSGLKNIVSKIEESNWTIEGCSYNPTLEQMKNGEWVKPQI